MREKDPELMKQILEYIEDYYIDHNASPSTTRIAEQMGIGRGTAHKYLVEMDERGCFPIRAGRSRRSGRRRCIYRLSGQHFSLDVTTVQLLCGQIQVDKAVSNTPIICRAALAPSRKLTATSTIRATRLPGRLLSTGMDRESRNSWELFSSYFLKSHL